MKRCPECEFLYENESTKCDMDGTPLRYTVALPSLPGLAKSIWDKWTIALLCAVVLGTVLVILYRATPRAYTSSSAGQMKSAPDDIQSAKQNAQPFESATPSESSAPEQAAEASDVSDRAGDPSTMTETKVQRAKRSSPLADEKEPSPAAAIHFEPVSNPPAPGTSSPATKPATTEATANEKSTTQTSSQTVSSSASSTPAHPKPPETYSNKAGTQNQKKDSAVKSFFKKAGKVLKKPFGEN